MWLMPSAIARRRTASAWSRSRGGPNTPGPGSCMAPKPTRPTWKEPSGKVCIVNAYTCPAGLTPIGSVLLGFAEDVVHLAAGIVDDVDDALLLLSGSGVGGLRDCARQLGDSGVQVDLSGVDAFGDYLPRRSLNLFGCGAAFVGQLEKPFTAFAFGADNEALVDQQLQGRVDRSRARSPQACAAIGDLLDHLVAVHCTLG